MYLSSRLHRNRHGVFGFRVVVPLHLRPFFAQREFRLTLRTTDRKVAKQCARHLNASLAALFRRIGRMSPEHPIDSDRLLVKELEAERDRLVRDLFALAEEADLDDRRDELAAQLERLVSEQQRLEGYLSTTRQLTEDQAAQCTSDAQRLVDARMRLLVDLHQLRDEESVQLHKAQELRERFQRLRMSAEHTETVQGLTEAFEARRTDMERLVEVAVRAGREGSSHDFAHEKIETLSGVLEAYRHAQLAERSWTAKSEIEVMAGLRLWLRIVGDQPISRYRHDQHRAYKGIVQRLPANLNKLPKYRGLSIDAVLALGGPPAAVNTVAKQLNRVSALFNWACKHGYIEINPAAGMKIRNPMRASEEREAFTTSDLQKIFESPEYCNAHRGEPYMFWMPLLALYTGARQTELAQLQLSDFVAVDGVHCLNINGDGEGKRLKTKAAKRMIPLHLELLRLGLVTHVTTLRQKGESRLFPELQPRRDGYGQTVSKWFRRFRIRCGITDRRKVFHSFRHTVIDALKQAGFPKEQIASLVGHDDDSVTFGRYGKPFEVQTMNRLVQALEFDSLTGQLIPYVDDSTSGQETATRTNHSDGNRAL